MTVIIFIAMALHSIKALPGKEKNNKINKNRSRCVRHG